MIDPTKLTDAELAACAQELTKRRMRCEVCGGDTEIWHVHVCGKNGGTNLPIEHPLVKAMCAA